jgi:hypothetical protein
VGTKVGSDGVSSSSNIYNNTTTTWEQDKKKIDNTMPKEWSEIDYAPLSHIGFKKDQILQLYKDKILDLDILQNSIYHFAFDLENNKREKEIKTHPLTFFMGILLRKGVYNAPANYESPKTKALRQYVETQEKLAKERNDLEERILLLNFDKWYENIDKIKRKEIFEHRSNSSSAEYKNDSHICRSVIRQYYRESIWPQVKKDLNFEKY